MTELEQENYAYYLSFRLTETNFLAKYIKKKATGKIQTSLTLLIEEYSYKLRHN